MSEQTTEIETKSLPTHVALCRERYANLNRRLLRLEVLYGGPSGGFIDDRYPPLDP